MKSYCLFFLALITVFSCKKADDIGGNVLLEGDYLRLYNTDSFLLNTKTVADEVLRTDKMISNYIGVLNSAQYGQSYARLMFELNIPQNVPEIATAPFTIDSAVLFLKYNIVYGDTNATQNIVVKTLNSNIAENQKYYSDNSTIFGTAEVGRADNIALQPSQKIKTFYEDTAGTASVIRIPIQNIYTQGFIDKIGSPDSALTNYTVFDNLFRGFEVAFENNIGNAMALVDLTSAQSKLAIFYKDRNGSVRELTFYSRLTTVVKGTNSYTQAASLNVLGQTLSTDVQNALSSTNTIDSINYIIGQSGTMNKITLPSFEDLKGKTAVNKAELYVTQTASNADTSTNTTILYAMYKDNSNRWAAVAIGSTDSILTISNNEKVVRYNFNLTTMINNILRNKISIREIYLSNHSASQNTDNELNDITYLGGYPPTKITVGGGNSSDAAQKTRLKLYYSKQ
jgi:hypothetical protein